MTAMDDYLGRVQATVWEAAGWVSAGGLARVQHLVDHGEPAEGMCSLAWIIVNEHVRVPRPLIDAIRQYAADLVDKELMPDDLESFALRAGESNDPQSRHSG